VATSEQQTPQKKVGEVVEEVVVAISGGVVWCGVVWCGVQFPAVLATQQQP